MEEGELIIAKVSLNAFKRKDPKKPYPVFEILSQVSSQTDGEIVVLRVGKVRRDKKLFIDKLMKNSS